jgi:hypothetical protein
VAVNVTVAGLPLPAESPFVAGTAGTGTASHFVDQYNDPILIRGYVLWGLLMNAGRWGGGTTWQSDLENAVDALVDLGVNVLYTEPFSNVTNGGANNSGNTWDGVTPFTGGDPASLNNTFWERTDYLLDLCEAAGITLFLNIAYSDDLDVGILSSFVTADFTDLGASLGARYANRPNLVWMVGGDYFDGFNTQLTALFTAISGQGDTHLVGVQNFPESTSRRDIENNNLQNTGNDNADFNFTYSYNVIYRGIEHGWGEASPIPVIWGDGHFDQGAGDRKLMRDLLWWALSSGARGSIYGNESTWPWGSSALSNLATGNFQTTDQPTIWDTFAALSGWHLLVPDTDDSLLTAGRGTQGDYVSGSGGSGGEYNAADSQDGYVTAAINAAGTLAVIYFPVDATITVDDTELAGGYTARWVDPADGSSTPTDTGATYSPTGNNSLGGPDWLLVIEGP